jgi:hypothetical protein
MPILRRNPRRFSTAESFRLFMEGIRGIQLHEDEAARSEIIQNGMALSSSRETLEQTLESAYKNLNECVAQYPDDLLPRYYRGIVFSLKAQEAQALQLAAYLDEPTKLPVTSREADDLSAQAVLDFRAVIGSAYGQLQLYAQYNSAQAMARLSGPTDWKNAIETLSHMDLDQSGLATLPAWKRILARLVTPFVAQERNVANFAGQLFRQMGGEHGVLSSLSKAKAEQEALRLQVELLKNFLIWRYNSRTDPGQDPAIDAKTKKYFLERTEVAVGWLAGFVQRIRKSPIPSEAMDDMEADYWNKTAFLMWEQTIRETDLTVRGILLQQAKTSIEKAMNLKGRKNWTPAQLNLARILLAQGSIADTKKVLDAILGAEPVKAPVSTSSPKQTAPIDTIVDLIVRMAPANNGQAIAQSIRAAWGKLDREIIQAILIATAGRVEPNLLSQVVASL